MGVSYASKRRIGRRYGCLRDIFFIVLFVVFIIEVVGFFDKKQEGKQAREQKITPTFESSAPNWRAISDKIMRDYQGKVICIESIKLSEDIGHYIRNVTGGMKGKKPSVHVFRNGIHIAVAQPSGMDYLGKLEVRNWDPALYKGQYRP
jgi:hypothetical protein